MSKVLRTLLTGLIVMASHSAAHAEPGVRKLAFLGVKDGYWQAWVANLDGSEARIVTTSAGDKTRVSWFPEHRRLLVNGQDGVLYEVNVETGEERALHAGMRGMMDGVLSPQGDRVVFSLSPTDTADKNDIWALDLARSEAIRIAAIPGIQDEPCFSTDGRTVYFSGGNGTTSHDLFSLDLKTRSTRQLTVAGAYHVECNASPGGLVAYSGNAGGQYDLYVLDPSGVRATTHWTNSRHLDGAPAWLPDGEGIVFVSTRSGTLNLWTISSPESEPRQITFNREGARGPSIHAVGFGQ